jgi:hypothetical protein
VPVGCGQVGARRVATARNGDIDIQERIQVLERCVKMPFSVVLMVTSGLSNVLRKTIFQVGQQIVISEVPSCGLRPTRCESVLLPFPPFTRPNTSWKSRLMHADGRATWMLLARVDHQEERRVQSRTVTTTRRYDCLRFCVCSMSATLYSVSGPTVSSRVADAPDAGGLESAEPPLADSRP